METDVYYKNAIIKPPKDIDEVRKIDRLVIDSKSRDKNLFPNSNDYELKIDEISDVVSSKLIYIDIPFSSYLINKYCNTFSFTGTTITIPIGDYTINELGTQLETLLSNITVTYNPKTSHYIFTGTGIFTLLFNDEIASILGFQSNKLYTSTANVIESVFKLNFKTNDYMILSIDQFDLLKSPESFTNKSFAIIPKKYSDMNIKDLPNYIKIFNPPIPRLHKIKIKIFDKYGNPADLQGVDHRFELEIESFKQKRKYGNIFS